MQTGFNCKHCGYLNVLEIQNFQGCLRCGIKGLENFIEQSTSDYDKFSYFRIDCANEHEIKQSLFQRFTEYNYGTKQSYAYSIEFLLYSKVKLITIKYVPIFTVSYTTFESSDAENDNEIQNEYTEIDSTAKVAYGYEDSVAIDFRGTTKTLLTSIIQDNNYLYDTKPTMIPHEIIQVNPTTFSEQLFEDEKYRKARMLRLGQPADVVNYYSPTDTYYPLAVIDIEFKNKQIRFDFDVITGNHTKDLTFILPTEKDTLKNTESIEYAIMFNKALYRFLSASSFRDDLREEYSALK